MKVSIVLGTRPQIIKSAPVYEALRDAGVDCSIVNTGQHYDYEMNREFFSELSLPDPAADLGVGKGSPAEQVGEIISKLGEHFSKHAPDVAIVPGDTNSALAAGIAASKAGVDMAHLESGCRSYDLRMAEEVNRRLLDHSSEVLLCPTRACVANLKEEKVLASVVENVGDTMFDSVLRYEGLLGEVDVEKRHQVVPREYAFMTLHRAEAVDDRGTLEALMTAVQDLKTEVLFSVHPRTKSRLEEFRVRVASNVKLTGPLPYLDTLALVKNSSFVITDSGGLQKEAYWLGRPILIARETTEWMEIVKEGAAKLVGTDPKKWGKALTFVRDSTPRKFASAKRIFGSGRASEKVARVISDYVEGARERR